MESGRLGSAWDSRTVVHVCADQIDRTVIQQLCARSLPDYVYLSVSTAQEALDVASAPDAPGLILFSELSLPPEGDGVIRSLKMLRPDVPLAVYGGRLARDAWRLTSLGVHGLISRALDLDSFGAALEFVAAGNRYASPELVHRPVEDGSACSFRIACGLDLPLLEDLPVMLFALVGGRIVHVNRSACTTLGSAVEGLRDRSFLSIVDEEHRLRATQLIATMSEGAAGLADAPRLAVLNLVSALGHRVQVDTRWGHARIAGIRALACVAVEVGVPDSRRHEAVGPLPADQSEEEQKRFGRLTERQRDVLRLVATGASNKEIAAQLTITEATAKLHVHKVLRALSLNNRTEAALFGRRLMNAIE